MAVTKHLKLKSSRKCGNFHLLLLSQQINKQVLSLRGVSQEEDPCFSEMLRDCGSPGSRSMGRRHPWVDPGGGVQMGIKEKEQCVLSLSLRESLSAVMMI